MPSMRYSEARDRVRPYLTPALAREYQAQVDRALWVELVVLIPAGIPDSICTDFGEMICEYVELELEDLWATSTLIEGNNK
jgi:hypothetical protein